jgi:hypothetical protein
VVRQRLSYFDEKWNVMDAILITLHLGTFILRVSPGDKGMAPLNMEQRRNGMNPDDNPSFYQVTPTDAAPRCRRQKEIPTPATCEGVRRRSALMSLARCFDFDFAAWCACARTSTRSSCPSTC